MTKKLKWLSIPIAAVLIAALLVMMLPVGVSISSNNNLVSIALAQEGYQPGDEMIEKRTSNSKTFWLGGNTYTLQTSIGAIHYRDAQGTWQDIDCDYSESDTEGFTAKFIKLPYIVRMGDDSARRVYPDRNDLSYWIELSKPFPSMGAPTKVGGYWVWNFTNAVIAVKIRPNAVKFGFRLKNSNAPTSITIPFSSQGITRDGNILLHNGQVVGYLQKPTAIDANGVEKDCQVSFSSGSITISLDTTGLAFPIEVDPTFSVGASSDDCFRALYGNDWTLTYTNFIVGASGSTYWQYGGGMRFQTITIPQGATINTAYLTFICPSARAGTVVKSRISAEDVNDAPTFANDRAAFDARWANRTTARMDWDSIPAWTLGASYNSPTTDGVTTFASIIKEIVDRAGWVSGNDIVIFWDDFDDRSTHATNCIRVGASWDHLTYNPPALYVEYTAGAPDITVSPTSKDFGVVAASSTPSTTTTYFTIDNNSTIQTDQTISVTTATWSGGVTWTHSDTATPNTNTAGLKANKGGTWGTGDIIVKYTAPNYIYENCPALTDYSFGLKLIAPTGYTDGVQKQIIVRITAVAG